MIELSFKILLSYLLGALMGSLVVGHLRGGVDIRQLGSRNAGGTNALRTQGTSFAFWVILIDVGKGLIATRLVAPFNMPGIPVAAPWLRDWLPAACGAAAIVGHIYPVWYGFRGGKGVATLLGALAGLDASLLITTAAIWLLTAVLTGYIGLASIVAALALPFSALLFREDDQSGLAFACVAAAIVLCTHRANIARMRSKEEPRSMKLWLFGRKRA